MTITHKGDMLINSISPRYTNIQYQKHATDINVGII